MSPKLPFKQSILDGCVLFLGRSVTDRLYALFTESGDTEAMAFLKLELIFRICDIGTFVK